MLDSARLTNPFPGLRPFEPSENHLFFGRDDQVHDLLGKLRKNRFVAVLGTSGSGKSSLVRAGLLPALYGGFMAKTGSSWRIAVLRPGNAPIRNLAEALGRPDVLGASQSDLYDPATIIEVTLSRGDLGLIEAARQARLPELDNLLIVVDQFEELFRFKSAIDGALNPDEASAFVALLLEASRNEKIPIYVTITMRSDFLGECSQFRDLPEVMNNGQFLVPRMTRGQRQIAITGPVAVGGGVMTSGLVQQLLNDVGNNPDQLPILQHALMRTWDHWALNRTNSDPLDIQAYENVGGMHAALSLHAYEAYEELPDERSKKIAEVLFKTITEIAADNREIRRPTKLGHICDIVEAEETAVIDVIDSFRKKGRSFLMPPRDVALTKDTLIDVSHESLIRNWEMLKVWVGEEARSAQIYRRLAETAVLHRDEMAGYWRDPDLQIALNWQKENNPNEAWGRLYHPEFNAAISFLQASKAKRDEEEAEVEKARTRELEQAQALVAEQSKAAKRLRIAIILMTIVILAGVFAIFAFVRQQAAVQKAATAEQDKVSAELAKVKSDSAAKAFAELFNEADSLRLLEEQVRQEVERQRQFALVARDSAALERERAEEQALLANQLRDDAVDARDNALQSQRQVQAVALAIKSEGLHQLGNDTLAALLALESYKYNERSGGQFTSEVYSALRQSLNAVSDNEGGPDVQATGTALITAMDFDASNNRAIVGGAEGEVYLQDVHGTAQSRLLGSHDGLVTVALHSTDGGFVITGGADLSIRKWSINTDNPELVGFHSSRIWSMAMNNDSNLLASGDVNGNLKLWQLGGNESSQTLGNLNGAVVSLAFNETGQTLASGVSDGKIVFWSTETERWTKYDSLQFNTAPGAITFLGDSLAAIGFENGIVRLLQSPGNKVRELRGHQKRVNDLAFSPDGKMLASGSSDKTVRLWNMHQLSNDPIVLSKDALSIRSVAFTASGDTLVCGTFGKDILLWQTDVVQLYRVLQRNVQRKLTPEEWQEFVGAGSDYPY